MTNSQTISILGCGWLGLPLAQKLIEKGYRIKGSTTNARKQETLEQAGIEPYLINLNEKLDEGYLAKFLDAQILIINLPPSKVETEDEGYVDRIRAIVNAAAQAGIPHLLFVSATSVYPKMNEEVDENTLLYPRKTNGKALLETENALHNHPYFKTTVLRVAGLIGYDRLPHKFLAFTADQKPAQERLNLVHRDDAIRAIETIIEQNHWDDTFNIVADEHPTRKTYYEHAAELLDAFPPAMTNDEEPRFKIVKNDKIKQVLGFEFKHPDPIKILDTELAESQKLPNHDNENQ